MLSNWSFKKPTKPGLYIVNCGDVVTEQTITFSEFYIEGGELIDQNGEALSEYPICYKFIRIDASKLNDHPNE